MNKECRMQNARAERIRFGTQFFLSAIPLLPALFSFAAVRHIFINVFLFPFKTFYKATKADYGSSAHAITGIHVLPTGNPLSVFIHRRIRKQKNFLKNALYRIADIQRKTAQSLTMPFCGNALTSLWVFCRFLLFLF